MPFFILLSPTHVKLSGYGLQTSVYLSPHLLIRGSKCSSGDPARWCSLTTFEPPLFSSLGLQKPGSVQELPSAARYIPPFLFIAPLLIALVSVAVLFFMLATMLFVICVVSFRAQVAKPPISLVATRVLYITLSI